MNAATLINQTSEKTEYYTPPEIKAAAVTLMGRIDLDPASSVAANAHIGANRIWTIGDNGLTKPWVAEKLWMNHPFSRVGNPLWIEKLMVHFQCGDVGEACCITYACTSEKWFQPLLKHPQCFLCPRTNYRTPDGKILRGVTKGSVVTYLGVRASSFADIFRHLGTVK